MKFVTSRCLRIAVFSLMLGTITIRLTEGIESADVVLIILSIVAFVADLFVVWINYKDLYDYVKMLEE